MKYLHRDAEKTIARYCSLFPAVALTGPRQSGKSTTLKKLFESEYRYVTFDDPTQGAFFDDDPKGFMKRHSGRVIFDEVQKAPKIFDYLKLAIDEDRGSYGHYILTGSSQFAFVKGITESLAGRIGMLSLLPFQYSEIPSPLRERQIVNGSYPELVMRKYDGLGEWYSSYIANYLERDVRSLYNLGNLRDFRRLLMLLAARSAQELNMSELAGEVGVSVNTIRSWISILEASYIIFLLPPYHRNLGKRIVKRPKIYFYDTGIICHLTGISDRKLLDRGPLAGPVFENYIVSEIKKIILHNGRESELYYFRNNLGLEADCIIEDRHAQTVHYVEIKNTRTAKPRMADSLVKLIDLEKNEISPSTRSIEGRIVYAGEERTALSDSIQFIDYRDLLEQLSHPAGT
ncbi:MAG TPA: ATP-binding protein [Spirochaetota bacterium]|nr:ATP-binding protein [Spirochaetota bacterium]HOS39789.1 ATP-binding protein [Spirochaetota bacterium]HPU88608.1 ATP-binding protein [Spirochaetota bacterium]